MRLRFKGIAAKQSERLVVTGTRGRSGGPGAEATNSIVGESIVSLCATEQ